MRAQEDSDVAYFYDLLHLGEFSTKLIAAGLVACLDDDRDRHRYRLEHDLVRASGLGDWASAIDDVLTGPASQVLHPSARAIQRELTQSFKDVGTEWQISAVRRLEVACKAVDPTFVAAGGRISGRRWFPTFAQLRNRTRGHGATRSSACSAACGPLRAAIDCLLVEFALLRLPWAYLRRNLSGKYRVAMLGGDPSSFEKLKSSRGESLQDGIYFDLGELRRVNLVAADEDLRDFYVANGGYTGARYELLSYVTDERLSADASAYSQPRQALPTSETQGSGALDLQGNCFGNLPPRTRDYVERLELEQELSEVLLNDRHPVITLVGRGGIGKTSLALAVLHRLTEADRYFSMVWFSSRDIELLPEGVQSWSVPTY